METMDNHREAYERNLAFRAFVISGKELPLLDLTNVEQCMRDAPSMDDLELSLFKKAFGCEGSFHVYCNRCKFHRQTNDALGHDKKFCQGCDLGIMGREMPEPGTTKWGVSLSFTDPNSNVTHIRHV